MSNVVRKLLVNKPYVEIGGVKWATMNIGANTETDYGLYFQWGDKNGYTSGQVGSDSAEYKKPFAWADYKFGNGTSNLNNEASALTKYNGTDGKTVLDETDDAAVANWGGNWRMPTREEFVALGNAVNTAWTTNYNDSGVNGLVCTDKTDNSKKLFFPAASYCKDGIVNGVGSYGDYWSSSRAPSDAPSAHIFNFASSIVNWQISYARYYGFSIRPVLAV